MSSSHPTNSTSEEEVDGTSMREGLLSFRSRQSHQSMGRTSRRPRTVHRVGVRSTSGPTAASTREKRDLDEALRKLTMLDDLAPTIDQQPDGNLQRREQSEADVEGGSMQHVYEQLDCLRNKLLQREGEVEVLKRTFEESWCRERKLFERICQLESFITTNQGGSQDQTGTTEEFRESQEAFWEQGVFSARSQAVITDPVIIEKLNLAYEDLTAIYDLRVDIDQQLNELHHGLIDPALRKQIIKIVREKELQLRSQRFTK